MHVGIMSKKCQINMTDTEYHWHLGLHFNTSIFQNGRDIELGFKDEQEFPEDLPCRVYSK
jgi:hypothetical protein